MLSAGGVVDIVTLDRAVWNHPPHKEEAGSPNVIGGVALAAAVRILVPVGMDEIAAHEQESARVRLRETEEDTASSSSTVPPTGSRKKSA